MENSDLIRFKDNLGKNVLEIYKKYGYVVAVNSVNKLIKDANKKSNKIKNKALAVQIRGECTELLLTLQIKEFARKRNLPWILSKGLTLERRDHKKGMTELDLTLFTPSKIVLFESKYRSGKFILIDECNLLPRSSFGYPANVYKQNLMHLDNLRKYLSSSLISMKRGKPFSITLYMSDTSQVEDKREEKYKNLIPLLNPKNTEKYLKSLERETVEIWDMNKLSRLLKTLGEQSEKNFEEHLNKVRR